MTPLPGGLPPTHMASRDHITLSGAPEGFDALLVSRELEKTGGPVVHVARDDKRLAAMQAAYATCDV